MSAVIPAAPAVRLGLLMHDIDAQREYACDRQSTVGRFDEALAVAPQAGWAVADMRREERHVFPSMRDGR